MVHVVLNLYYEQHDTLLVFFISNIELILHYLFLDYQNYELRLEYVEIYVQIIYH